MTENVIADACDFAADVFRDGIDLPAHQLGAVVFADGLELFADLVFQLGIAQLEGRATWVSSASA